MKTLGKNNADNSINRDLAILILTGMVFAVGLVAAGVFLINQL